MNYWLSALEAMGLKLLKSVKAIYPDEADKFRPYANAITNNDMVVDQACRL
jgi:hypothetical protein